MVRSMAPAGLLLLCSAAAAATTLPEKIMAKPGCVAFWDFKTKGTNGNFVAQSNYAHTAGAPDLYPVWLRNGGHEDSPKYTEATWKDTSKLVVNRSADGPFGSALKIQEQRLWATVDRADFQDTPLDISGNSPMTMVAWVKIAPGSNKHHMVGIWDEGTWDKYSGQRQYSLFNINRFGRHLFGHISATGAASYPQATGDGSQYARTRALNGDVELTQGVWHMIAMSYDGSEAKSYQDGASTPYDYSSGQEWVEESVYKQWYKPRTNPKAMDFGVYHPRRFVVKFNGYNVNADQVFEHYVRVDVRSSNKKIEYGVKAPNLEEIAGRTYTVSYRFMRGTTTLEEGSFTVSQNKGSGPLSSGLAVQHSDELFLQLKQDGNLIGKEVRREIKDGAPFSFGRVLGTGPHFDLGGVAMYNRVLSADELNDLAMTADATSAPAVTTPTSPPVPVTTPTSPPVPVTTPTSPPVPVTSAPKTPPPSACTDVVLQGGRVWNDAGGASYTCAWYALSGPSRCASYGDRYKNEYVAKEACCVCGGGMTRTSAPTRTRAPRTPQPTRAPSSGCTDRVLPGGRVWSDAAGTSYTCAWYAKNNGRCQRYGGGHKNRYVANDACCVCGGGDHY